MKATAPPTPVNMPKVARAAFLPADIATMGPRGAIPLQIVNITIIIIIRFNNH